VRFALVSYRDHPPQDSSYVTRVFPFTPDVAEMQQYVSTMSASGGGDGPEAVTAALDDALNLPWRPNATKVAVLIADAPPHGLEPTGDGFPEGDPEGRDPLELARTMAAHGITVYAVGCEPALGSYRFARDFMCSLAEITGGQAVALSSAKNLADVIINGSAEEISLTHLSREVEEEIERVQAMDLDASEEQVFQQAAMNLQERSVKSKHMRHDGAMSQAAPEVWKKATSLRAAKADLCARFPEPKGKGKGSLRSVDFDDEDKMSSVDSCVDTMSFSVMSMEEKSMALASSSRSFSKSAKTKKTKSAGPSLMSAMSSWFGGSATAKGAPPASLASEDEEVDAPRFRSAPAPMKVKTLGHNVLEEDVISLEQVARIGRKSASKRAA
jgi:hypothetical protein